MKCEWNYDRLSYKHEYVKGDYRLNVRESALYGENGCTWDVFYRGEVIAEGKVEGWVLARKLCEVILETYVEEK